MKKMILASLLAVTASCGKHPVEYLPTADKVDKIFEGTWRLVQYQGGISGTIITEADLGYKTTIIFERPGNMKEYKNDTELLRSDHFSLSEHEDFHHTLLIKDIIDYNNLNDQWVKVMNDSLYLYDACDDCYHYLYVKE